MAATIEAPVTTPAPTKITPFSDRNPSNWSATRDADNNVVAFNSESGESFEGPVSEFKLKFK